MISLRREDAAAGEIKKSLDLAIPVFEHAYVRPTFDSYELERACSHSRVLKNPKKECFDYSECNSFVVCKDKVDLAQNSHLKHTMFSLLRMFGVRRLTKLVRARIASVAPFHGHSAAA